MTEAANEIKPAIIKDTKQSNVIPYKRICRIHHAELRCEGEPPDQIWICEACNNDKLLCDLFAVKDKNYISRKQMENAIRVLYDKVNELTLELFCENPNHSEFNGIPPITHGDLILKKIERMISLNKETNRK